jgi:predicted transcriptional regulator
MARYTIDFAPDFEQLLESLAAKKSATKAEIIRRAVASYSYLDKQVNSETGTKVSVTNSEDKVLKDVVLP